MGAVARSTDTLCRALQVLSNTAAVIKPLQVAYTTPWIIMLSQLAYYSKIYGPQVRRTAACGHDRTSALNSNPATIFNNSQPCICSWSKQHSMQQRLVALQGNCGMGVPASTVLHAAAESMTGVKQLGFSTAHTHCRLCPLHPVSNHQSYEITDHTFIRTLHQ